MTVRSWNGHGNLDVAPRGYYFILVGSQIVVIEPSSYQIIAVLA